MPGRSSSGEAAIALVWAMLAAVACGPGTTASPVDAAPSEVPPANHGDAAGADTPLDGAAPATGGGGPAGSGGAASGGSATGGAASGGSGSGGQGSGGRGSGGSSSSSGGSGPGGRGSGASASGGGGAAGRSSAAGGAGAGGATAGRGFPSGQPWVAFYGSPTSTIDLAKVAAAFRIIDIDADPDVGFTTAQIAQLRSSGQNRVVSYMNVGSCESFRSYYAKDPAGHKSCTGSGALTEPYFGFDDEMWADLSNAAYQDLILNHVAPRLIAQGVDGFFLDNMEVVEHGLTPVQGGPCAAACAQGGLDLVWQLRQKFPDKLIVMQNAVSSTTRAGITHGVAFPGLLDGISVESVFANGTRVATDSGTLTQVLAWRDLGLRPGDRPFWLGVEDYLGACTAANKPTATTLYTNASTMGLSEYVTDMSGQQHAPCYWSDFP
jgi:cysteinyl-tRNA synthetase